MAVRSCVARLRHDIGRARAGACHAHVERPVGAEREAALGLIELHRRHAEIEHHAVDQLVAVTRDGRRKIGEPILLEHKPAIAGSDEIGSLRTRTRIAIDRDHIAARGIEHRAAITASSECCIEIDAAIAHGEILDRAAAEHRNVTGQSASDSGTAAAARHHSRAPGGPSAAIRELSCCLSARTFSVASASSARKRSGSQI